MVPRQTLQRRRGQHVTRHHQLALEAAASFLVSSQNGDGGWGYSLGQPSVVEPTATAFLALQPEAGSRAACEQAMNWLQAAQNPDGGWGLTAEDDESGWQTGWAVLALARGCGARDAVDRGAAWLLSVAVHEAADDGEKQRIRELVAIDPDLRGWSWQPGEASFVEPTALAIQALCSAEASRQNQVRLEEAVAYLKDRRCPGGGWNVGSPTMLGKALVPRAHPTAWALLALILSAPDAIVPEDAVAMRADMEQDGGALALAWGSLTLAALGQEDADAAAILARLQGEDGSWDQNPYHTAVAMLAIQGN